MILSISAKVVGLNVIKYKLDVLNIETEEMLYLSVSCPLDNIAKPALRIGGDDFEGTTFIEIDEKLMEIAGVMISQLPTVWKHLAQVRNEDAWDVLRALREIWIGTTEKAFAKEYLLQEQDELDPKAHISYRIFQISPMDFFARANLVQRTNMAKNLASLATKLRLAKVDLPNKEQNG